MSQCQYLLQEGKYFFSRPLGVLNLFEQENLLRILLIIQGERQPIMHTVHPKVPERNVVLPVTLGHQSDFFA